MASHLDVKCDVKIWFSLKTLEAGNSMCCWSGKRWLVHPPCWNPGTIFCTFLFIDFHFHHAQTLLQGLDEKCKLGQEKGKEPEDSWRRSTYCPHFFVYTYMYYFFHINFHFHFSQWGKEPEDSWRRSYRRPRCSPLSLSGRDLSPEHQKDHCHDHDNHEEDIILIIIVILKIVLIMLTIACISGQTILRQSGGAASQDPEGRHVTLVVKLLIVVMVMAVIIMMIWLVAIGHPGHHYSHMSF